MQTRSPGTAQGLVCGMSGQPDSPHKATYEGQEFGFCSGHCLAAFKQDPEKYTKLVAGEKPGVSLAAPEEKPETPTTYLTCPMHHEVMVPAPRCPKCGMFLERPTEAQVEEEKPGHGH